MLVKVVPVTDVPVADVFAKIVPPVTVNPVVTFDTKKVYDKPATFAGSVHDGLPEVDRFINTPPDCEAVKTTVAPTNALKVTDRVVPAENTGVFVKVDTPVNVDVPPTTRLLSKVSES